MCKTITQKIIHGFGIYAYLCNDNQNVHVMEATINLNYNQVLQIVQQMPVRSQLRLGKYLAKLAKGQKDPTLLSKEEFFAKIERAEQQMARGEGMEMLPGEDLSAFLIRNGYDI